MEAEEFYVYEAGQLRTSSGKPLYKKSRPHHTVLRTTPFYSSAATTTHKNLHTAPSLLNITIQLVADNLHLVESFVGFPEQIGEAIFKEALLKDRFKDNLSYMNLFSDAYGVNVLREACITSSSVLNRVLSTYSGLHNVVKLDVAGCRVGDDHPLISSIAQDFLRLTHLGLSNNSLTSDAIRTLTMPCKMFGRGPQMLQVLDLSLNPYLSHATFKYLRCFKHLQLVDVTGNSLMKDALHVLDEFSVQEHKPDWYNDVCGTEGWARDVLLDCMKDFTTNPSIAGFYGRKQRGLCQLSKTISDKSCLVLVATARKKATGKPHRLEADTGSKQAAKNEKIQRPLSAEGTDKSSECQDDAEMHSLFQAYLAHM